MQALTRRRPLIWIALFAWFAQLCVPTAHAALMASPDAGIAAWCGDNATGLRAQIARLDPELREILDPHATQAQAHADCALFCASGHGADPLAAPVSVLLRAAGADAAPLEPLRAPRAARSYTPPARGPPRST